MFLKLYLIALPVFLVINIIWLTLVAKNFYAKHIGYLLAKDPNLLAAAVFYLIFIAGLIVFVITPAIDKKMWKEFGSILFKTNQDLMVHLIINGILFEKFWLNDY